jgi:hypothetical protein
LLFTGGVIADFLIKRLPFAQGSRSGEKAAVLVARQVNPYNRTGLLMVGIAS